MKKYNELELQEIVKKSSTYREVLHKFERNESGASYKTLYRRLNEWKIDTSHFLNRSEMMKLNYDAGTIFIKKTNDELFEINNVSRATIKNRIVAENLIEYKCKFCGQNENWFGKKISLILDHINGVNNDNHLENLRFLCPNCNATLETHCKGASALTPKSIKIKRIRISPPRLNQRKVKERPTLIEINEMLKTMSYCAIGRKYNVSDNAIRRWIELYKKLEIQT
jgi:predicted RNA-binding Zn-ribbon protein involved in translation (DUF1610 family)